MRAALICCVVLLPPARSGAVHMRASVVTDCDYLEFARTKLKQKLLGVRPSLRSHCFACAFASMCWSCRPRPRQPCTV